MSTVHSRDAFSHNGRHASLGLAALVALALVAPLQLACGGGTVLATRVDPFERAAATRAAAELECEQTALMVRALGASSYVVSGCGGSRTYACTTHIVGWGLSARREVVCMAQPDASGGAQQRPPPRVWTNDSVLEAVRTGGPGVAACLAPEHRPARMSIAISPRGIVRAQRWFTEASPPERDCVDRVLAGLNLEGEVDVGRTVTVAFVANDSAAPTDPASEDDAVGTFGAETAPGISGASSSTAYSDSLRQSLDEAAATILTCTDGAPVAIAIEWSAARVTVALRGSLHGTDVEGCVVALTEDLPRPGAAEPSGRLLHVVRQ